MQLYIPELGTKLILSCDWKFKLFSERRNSSLVTAFQLESQFKELNKKRYEEILKLTEEMRQAFKDSGENLTPGTGFYATTLYTEKRSYVSDYRIFISTKDREKECFARTISIENELIRLQETESFVQIVLPQSTTLQLDRIYVRSGNSKYSSLSFLILDSPNRAIVPKSRGGTGSGKMRFWAKLEDCNEMHIEQPIISS